MADTIVVYVDNPPTTIEVAGPQGPQGPPGTGLDTLTTKGDTLGHNGTAAVRVPVGSNGQVLTADSTATPGVKWATPASSAAWADITGKPSTFPPETHTHAAADVTSGTFVAARIPFASPSAIGSTTAAPGTFTNLTATAELQLPLSAPGSPSAGDLYRVSDTLRYRDGSNVERLLLNATDNLANLASAATARTNLGLGSANSPTFAGVTLGTSGVLVGGTNLVEQYNSTNAQTLNIYNTRTDASNYERLAVQWSSNVCNIGTQKLGTGSAREIALLRDGTTVLRLSNPITAYQGFHVTQSTGSENLWQVYRADNKYIGVMSDHRLVWCNSATGSFFSGPSIDTGIGRNAAGVVEVNNGTLGTFRDMLFRDLELRPSSSRTPSVNGSLMIEATSNTSLTFKYRGSDGTTRSVALTLA